MRDLLRPVVYAVCALAGVKLVEYLRPTSAHAAEVLSLSGFVAAFGSGGIAGVKKEALVDAEKIKAGLSVNIALGVAVGCLVAGVLDSLVS